MSDAPARGVFLSGADCIMYAAALREALLEPPLMNRRILFSLLQRLESCIETRDHEENP